MHTRGCHPITQKSTAQPGTASTYSTSTVALLDNYKLDHYKQQFERLYSIDYITKLIQLKRQLVLVWCARLIYTPAAY